MNEKLFKTEFTGLQKYFGHHVEEMVYKIYWHGLQRMPDGAFNMAIRNIIKDFRPTSQVPFPLISDFLKYCGVAGEIRAQKVVTILIKAITEVGAYESVDFRDPYLHLTIIRFGGWPAICTWDSKEWDINYQRFIEAYKTVMLYGECSSSHLIGITERENQLKGYDKYINKPRLISGSEDLKLLE